MCLIDLYHFPPLLSMPWFYAIILYSVLYGFSREQQERFLQRGKDKRPTTSDFASNCYYAYSMVSSIKLNL